MTLPSVKSYLKIDTEGKDLPHRPGGEANGEKTMKIWCIVLLLLLLLGCKPQINDLQQYVAQVKQNTPVRIEPYPSFTTSPAFEYSADTLRSPFQRLSNAQQAQAPVQHKSCPQPDFSHTKQALERYGADAMQVIGMFSIKGNNWALLQTNDGNLHKATVGDYLGLFFGRITAIQKNGTVLYSEMLPDGTGCWQKKKGQLSMLVKTGENNV
ncbi:MAG: type IV pilus assembly protein PilP [Paraglaciecola sp.]|jgi:type IV pilus assembly protein PilP